MDLTVDLTRRWPTVALGSSFLYDRLAALRLIRGCIDLRWSYRKPRDRLLPTSFMERCFFFDPILFLLNFIFNPPRQNRMPTLIWASRNPPSLFYPVLSFQYSFDRESFEAIYAHGVYILCRLYPVQMGKEGGSAVAVYTLSYIQRRGSGEKRNIPDV